MSRHSQQSSYQTSSTPYSLAPESVQSWAPAVFPPPINPHKPGNGNLSGQDWRQFVETPALNTGQNYGASSYSNSFESFESNSNEDTGELEVASRSSLGTIQSGGSYTSNDEGEHVPSHSAASSHAASSNRPTLDYDRDSSHTSRSGIAGISSIGSVSNASPEFYPASASSIDTNDGAREVKGLSHLSAISSIGSISVNADPNDTSSAVKIATQGPDESTHRVSEVIHETIPGSEITEPKNLSSSPTSKLLEEPLNASEAQAHDGHEEQQKEDSHSPLPAELHSVSGVEDNAQKHEEPSNALARPGETSADPDIGDSKEKSPPASAFGSPTKSHPETGVEDKAENHEEPSNAPAGLDIEELKKVSTTPASDSMKKSPYQETMEDLQNHREETTPHNGPPTHEAENHGEHDDAGQEESGSRNSKQSNLEPASAESRIPSLGRLRDILEHHEDVMEDGETANDRQRDSQGGSPIKPTEIEQTQENDGNKEDQGINEGRSITHSQKSRSSYESRHTAKELDKEGDEAHLQQGHDHHSGDTGSMALVRNSQNASASTHHEDDQASPSSIESSEYSTSSYSGSESHSSKTSPSHQEDEPLSSKGPGQEIALQHANHATQPSLESSERNMALTGQYSSDNGTMTRTRSSSISPESDIRHRRRSGSSYVQRDSDTPYETPSSIDSHDRHRRHRRRSGSSYVQRDSDTPYETSSSSDSHDRRRRHRDRRRSYRRYRRKSYSTSPSETSTSEDRSHYYYYDSDSDSRRYDGRYRRRGEGGKRRHRRNRYRQRHSSSLLMTPVTDYRHDYHDSQYPYDDRRPASYYEPSPRYSADGYMSPEMPRQYDHGRRHLPGADPYNDVPPVLPMEGRQGYASPPRGYVSPILPMEGRQDYASPLYDDADHMPGGRLSYGNDGGLPPSPIMRPSPSAFAPPPRNVPPPPPPQRPFPSQPPRVQVSPPIQHRFSQDFFPNEYDHRDYHPGPSPPLFDGYGPDEQQYQFASPQEPPTPRPDEYTYRDNYQRTPPSTFINHPPQNYLDSPEESRGRSRTPRSNVNTRRGMQPERHWNRTNSPFPGEPQQHQVVPEEVETRFSQDMPEDYDESDLRASEISSSGRDRPKPSSPDSWDFPNEYGAAGIGSHAGRNVSEERDVRNPQHTSGHRHPGHTPFDPFPPDSRTGVRAPPSPQHARNMNAGTHHFDSRGNPGETGPKFPPRPSDNQYEQHRHSHGHENHDLGSESQFSFKSHFPGGQAGPSTTFNTPKPDSNPKDDAHGDDRVPRSGSFHGHDAPVFDLDGLSPEAIDKWLAGGSLPEGKREQSSHPGPSSYHPSKTGQAHDQEHADPMKNSNHPRPFSGSSHDHEQSRHRHDYAKPGSATTPGGIGAQKMPTDRFGHEKETPDTRAFKQEQTGPSKTSNGPPKSDFSGFRSHSKDDGHANDRVPKPGSGHKDNAPVFDLDGLSPEAIDKWLAGGSLTESKREQSSHPGPSSHHPSKPGQAHDQEHADPMKNFNHPRPSPGSSHDHEQSRHRHDYVKPGSATTPGGIGAQKMPTDRFGHEKETSDTRAFKQEQTGPSKTFNGPAKPDFNGFRSHSKDDGRANDRVPKPGSGHKDNAPVFDLDGRSPNGIKKWLAGGSLTGGKHEQPSHPSSSHHPSNASNAHHDQRLLDYRPPGKERTDPIKDSNGPRPSLSSSYSHEQNRYGPDHIKPGSGPKSSSALNPQVAPKGDVKAGHVRSVLNGIKSVIRKKPAPSLPPRGPKQQQQHGAPVLSDSTTKPGGIGTQQMRTDLPRHENRTLGPYVTEKRQTDPSKTSNEPPKPDFGGFRSHAKANDIPGGGRVPNPNPGSNHRNASDIYDLSNCSSPTIQKWLDGASPTKLGLRKKSSDAGSSSHHPNHAGQPHGQVHGDQMVRGHAPPSTNLMRSRNGPPISNTRDPRSPVVEQKGLPSQSQGKDVKRPVPPRNPTPPSRPLALPTHGTVEKKPVTTTKSAPGSVPGHGDQRHTPFAQSTPKTFEQSTTRPRLLPAPGSGQSAPPKQSGSAVSSGHVANSKLLPLGSSTKPATGPVSGGQGPTQPEPPKSQAIVQTGPSPLIGSGGREKPKAEEDFWMRRLNQAFNNNNNHSVPHHDKPVSVDVSACPPGILKKFEEQNRHRIIQPGPLKKPAIPAITGGRPDTGKAITGTSHQSPAMKIPPQGSQALPAPKNVTNANLSTTSSSRETNRPQLPAPTAGKKAPQTEPGPKLKFVDRLRRLALPPSHTKPGPTSTPATNGPLNRTGPETRIPHQDSKTSARVTPATGRGVGNTGAGPVPPSSSLNSSSASGRGAPHPLPASRLLPSSFTGHNVPPQRPRLPLPSSLSGQGAKPQTSSTVPASKALTPAPKPSNSIAPPTRMAGSQPAKSPQTTKPEPGPFPSDQSKSLAVVKPGRHELPKAENDKYWIDTLNQFYNNPSPKLNGATIDTRACPSHILKMFQEQNKHKIVPAETSKGGNASIGQPIPGASRPPQPVKIPLSAAGHKPSHSLVSSSTTSIPGRGAPLPPSQGRLPSSTGHSAPPREKQKPSLSNALLGTKGQQKLQPPSNAGPPPGMLASQAAHKGGGQSTSAKPVIARPPLPSTGHSAPPQDKQKPSHPTASLGTGQQKQQQPSNVAPPSGHNALPRKQPPSTAQTGAGSSSMALTRQVQKPPAQGSVPRPPLGDGKPEEGIDHVWWRRLNDFKNNSSSPDNIDIEGCPPKTLDAFIRLNGDKFGQPTAGPPKPAITAGNTSTVPARPAQPPARVPPPGSTSLVRSALGGHHHHHTHEASIPKTGRLALPPTGPTSTPAAKGSSTIVSKLTKHSQPSAPHSNTVAKTAAGQGPPSSLVHSSNVRNASPAAPKQPNPVPSTTQGKVTLPSFNKLHSRMKEEEHRQAKEKKPSRLAGLLGAKKTVPSQPSLQAQPKPPSTVAPPPSTLVSRGAAGANPNRPLIPPSKEVRANTPTKRSVLFPFAKGRSSQAQPLNKTPSARPPIGPTPPSAQGQKAATAAAPPGGKSPLPFMKHTASTPVARPVNPSPVVPPATAPKQLKTTTAVPKSGGLFSRGRAPPQPSMPMTRPVNPSRVVPPATAPKQLKTTTAVPKSGGLFSRNKTVPTGGAMSSSALGRGGGALSKSKGPSLAVAKPASLGTARPVKKPGLFSSKPKAPQVPLSSRKPLLGSSAKSKPIKGGFLGSKPKTSAISTRKKATRGLFR